MKITGKRPQFFISGNIHTAIQCTLSKKPLLDDGYCLEIAISERIDLRLGWQYFIDLSIGVFGTFRLVRVTDYPSQFVNRQFDYIYQFDSIGDLTIGKSGAFSASQRYPEWSIKTRDDWLTFADFIGD